jgi:hypothetical protein
MSGLDSGTSLSRAGAGAPTKVLLGVMTAPQNARLRFQWRDWRGGFNETERNGGVFDLRFVLGREFHRAPKQATRPSEVVAAEEKAHRDFIYVDGRERLPHVGKVTEKSASWWLSIASEKAGYDFYCKTDDDTLAHVDRLHRTLATVKAARGADASTYLGLIKWRGWDVAHRFQACGGGWGPAGKTGDDIAAGGVLPGGKRYPPCPHAAGPYPYMSGGMVCMSQALVRTLAADAAFRDFYNTARLRNSAGVACRSPYACAAQPVASHMWHHEDAGVGFNVFRAVVAANSSAAIVPVPGHFNDAGIIERTQSAQDRYWSSRSVFVHGIKGPSQYTAVHSKWHLHRKDAPLGLRCYPCNQPGINM